MVLSNREFIGRTLDILSKGLEPYIDRAMAEVSPAGKLYVHYGGPHVKLKLYTGAPSAHPNDSENFGSPCVVMQRQAFC